MSISSINSYVFDRVIYILWQIVARCGKIQEMLIGEYQTKLAQRSRTSIPKRFRDELLSKDKTLILTRGYEGSLLLLNKQMWEKVAGDAINGSFINSNIRETTRFLVGGATEVIPDSLGRIIIPKPLIEHATIGNEIVFVGLVNWIEIWSSQNWQKKLIYLGKNSNKIANELTK